MKEAFAHLTVEDTTVERGVRGQDALEWAGQVVEGVGLLKD